MGVYVLTNARLFVGGFDLSCDFNSLSLSTEVEEHDVSTFCNNGYRSRVAGLSDIGLSGSGFWDSDGTSEPDDVFFGNLGLDNVAMTVVPEALSDGGRAYSFQGVQFEYSPNGNVGQPLAFDVSARGKTAMAQGTVLHPGTDPVTASGSGVPRNLGLVTSGKKLYAALHVWERSGTTPNLTVRVQSDDAQAFTTPTDQITFDTATAVGGQFKSVSGPIASDNWWRVDWTLTGTTPSVKFIVTAGIR